jgi:WD40 repeat protein/predicted Ser/Thr protein kinase
VSVNSFPPSDRSPDDDPSDRLERLVLQFERLWLEGRKPSIDDFLAAPGTDRLPVLVELVHVELELRLKAGEKARVEEYLERYPELAEDPGLVWGLIDAEYRQRARREPRLTLDEYLRRFPRWEADLARLEPSRITAASTPVTAHGKNFGTTLGGLPGRSNPAVPSTEWPDIPDVEVLEELGRGGMGVVYKGWQVSLGRVVALKVLRSGAGAEEMARFRIEAEAVARLSHPNIVQIYQVGEHGGLSYLILEYIEGESLSKRLAGTTWPARAAAELVRTLAAALQHAHDRGVLHRDLSPANVLLGADGAPKVTDFGLAKLVVGAGIGQTRTVAVMGTPSYMSPEQATGKARLVGATTDVWALGAILYRLLAGRPPFWGESSLETLRQVESEDPVPPRRLQPAVPRDLETICLKCLQKRPLSRYHSARALADDLGRFLEGAPVQARPPSPFQLAASWARRHPTMAALLVSALLLALTLTGGSLWYSARLTQALEEAQRERLHATRNEQRARQAEYASDLRLAQRLLQRGDVFPLAGLLDRHRPDRSDAEDLRGFEWRYLSAHRQPAPRTWSPHPRGVSWVAYSPDGRWLTTAGEDGEQAWTVKVRDTRTGKFHFSARSAAPLDGYGPLAAFAPAGAGWLAINEGPAVALWDLTSGRQRNGRCEAPEGLFAVAVSPDGRWLFTAGRGPVTVWDVAGQAPRYSFPDPSRNTAQLSLSADGRLLATVHVDRTVRLWDVTNRRLRTVVGQAGGTGPLGFSPRGSLLTGTTLDRQMVVWDATGRPQSPWAERPRAPTGAVVVSLDERTLAVGGEDGGVEFWDVLARTRRARLHWQTSPVTALAFCPDGKHLAVATRDGTVYEVGAPDRHESETLQPSLIAHPVIAFAADGKTLAVAAQDRTVRLLDAADGQTRAVLRGALNAARALAVAADGRAVAAISASDHTVHLWETAPGGKQWAVAEAQATCVAFSSSGTALAVGTQRGSILLLEPGSGSVRGTLPSRNPTVEAVTFSPDGRTLASAGSGGFLELWDLSRGVIPTASVASQRLDREVSCLAYFPNGRSLVTGEENGTVLFWQATGNRLERARGPLQLGGAPGRLDVSRDGKNLLTHTLTGDVRLFDTTTLVSSWRLPLRARGPLGPCVALSPVRDNLALVGPDGIFQLCDLDGWKVQTVPGQPPWAVRSLVFSPDGKELITGSDAPRRMMQGFTKFPLPRKPYESIALYGGGTTVRVWDVANGEERAGPAGPATMVPPHQVALSPDGRILAAGGTDGSVTLWDRGTNRRLTRLFAGPTAKLYAQGIEAARQGVPVNPIYPESLRSLAFSRDGRLVTASTQGVVKVWEADSWGEARAFSCDARALAFVCFAPSGELVTTNGGQVQFRDPRTGAVQIHLGDPTRAAITCVAFTADGTLLATAHRDRHVRLWELPSGREQGTLIGHLDRINALTFSPDGRTLASGGNDRTVKLWSIRAVAEVASFEAHRGKVHCLAFSPAGTVLASGGETADGRGEVFLWRAPSP